MLAVWTNALAKRFGIKAVPQSFLVDKQGRLRGLEAWRDLEASVERLLAE